jgi:hypothetical protein
MMLRPPASADMNGDGYVDKAELIEQVIAGVKNERKTRKSDPPASRFKSSSSSSRSSSNSQDMYDLDKDGKLSRAEPRSVAGMKCVRLTKEEGYGRLVQRNLELKKGETYHFSCRIAGHIRFGKHDHVPQLLRGAGLGRVGPKSYTEKDGWTKLECSLIVNGDETYDLALSVWNLSSIEIADVSLRPNKRDVELVRNGRFQAGLKHWEADGGEIELLANFKPTVREKLDGLLVTYRRFDGKTEELTAYEGEEIVLLVPQQPVVDSKKIRGLVQRLDLSWRYYAITTGRQPSTRTTQLTVDNKRMTIYKPALVVVKESCGAGCGLVGAAGIEIMPQIWTETYRNHVTGAETRGLFEYEMGRNFWMYHAQLHSDQAQKYHLATAFATVFGYKAGVAAGSTTKPGNNLVDWVQSFRDAFDKYVDDPDFSFLLNGDQPAEKVHGGLWLYFGDKYGEQFYPRFFNSVAKQPRAKSLNDAVGNYIVAASVAAGKNLEPWFREKLSFPDVTGLNHRVDDALRNQRQH